MIPHDDFTPHGYLDNPDHSWKLNPSGVLRSLEPLGMGWHVPNLGSYVRNQFQYTAHLTIGLKINDTVLITADDFARHGCTISSHLHTKNRFEYTCIVPQYGLTLTARYFLVREHALGCTLSLAAAPAQQLSVTCYVMHLHTHNPHTSRLWEHGLYASPGVQQGTAMLGIASEGDVFVHGARAADGLPLAFGEMGYVVSLEEASAWARGMRVASPHVTQSQKDTGWQIRTVILLCHLNVGGNEEYAERSINIVLARGVSQDQSCQRWEDGIAGMARAEADHHADDEVFWQRAPQLSGDWPDTWRRGFACDFETLRMTIRPAAGVIPHPWDGMQIQAPRTVLAEAAMDVLYLSYADPELAAEVILCHFASSPRPNLPCMREDGSYNMVADDGQVCGTAPEWGFPVWCLDQLFRRSGDLDWLRRLYPRVAAYLRWWLEQRADSEGWLVYACSWESGQDVSSRFGPQQTGGTLIEHVRPSDLQASMAQAAAILSRWAIMLAETDAPENTVETVIDYPAEAAFWESVVDTFTARTRLMWRGGWFRDYDSGAREWSALQDAMHLAPVFCGVASMEQVDQLRLALANPPAHSSGWQPLSWPPVVMTLVGAAASARMSREAAELAYRYIDGSYRSMDSREPDEHSGLPGVTREYRSLVDAGKHERIYAGAGIEGYGWGALSIHLILRYLLGLREVEAGRISVAPALPQALCRAGAVYRVEPVQWGGYVLSVECVVQDEQGYTMRLRCAKREQSAAAQTYEWQGIWGEERTLSLPDSDASSASR